MSIVFNLSDREIFSEIFSFQSITFTNLQIKLLNKNIFSLMQVMYTFRARCHGAMNAAGKDINQLTRNGNTPTGLVVQIPYLNFPSKFFFIIVNVVLQYSVWHYVNIYLFFTIIDIWPQQSWAGPKIIWPVSIFSNYFNRINGSQH